MSQGLIIAIVLVAIVYIIVRFRARNSSASSFPPPPDTKASPEAYQGLRNMILQGSRERFGLAPTAKPEEPWGVVMDWGVTSGTATVMALSDGSASIYVSGGGGYLGGQKHESIRNAARQAVAVAAEYQPQMQVTTTYHLPVAGEVIFYVLTDAGIFTTTEKEVDLREASHPLAKLGSALQNVVTQYRIIEEWKK